MSEPRVIFNRPLVGETRVVPSKSVSHRALICAFLADGESKLQNLGECDDVEATRRCLAALRNREPMDAGESATTMRLLLPLSLLYGGGRFLMRGSLINRPLEPYAESLDVKLYRNGDEILVSGCLEPGEYRIRGDVSSQFISGLLFALPLLHGDSALHVTGELQSRPYVELTRMVMERFGVYVKVAGDGFLIPGKQSYRSADFTVEGDWTYAANFLAANALGGNVRLSGLDMDSLQGDRQVLSAFGKDEIDVSDMPDTFPALAVYACSKRGPTLITGGHRLRYKECDRLNAMAVELHNLGADVEERHDSLLVRGTGRLRGGKADAHGDHRVAMALSIAAAICESPVELYGGESVKKSAPAFFEALKALGGTD
ncbi:MAG: 3-phosphoshikimate 1-carboxyvinyltransferase [Eubacteriales bacterium]|nr:3-phosphoshikimate 1-carboxyvinyltransferase [Eubacteriales bacterium]